MQNEYYYFYELLIEFYYKLRIRIIERLENKLNSSLVS